MKVTFSLLGPVALTARNLTPVTTGRPDPSGKKFGIVAFATVNGFHALLSGTLMPLGLNPTLVPGMWNGSGSNGTAARDASKNDRESLKSPNTVRYLSHRSRVNDP